ncbi:unnamed protein product, partial [Rotaria sordida]
QSPSYQKVRKDEEFADWMKQWCKISEYEEIEHIQKFFRMLVSNDTSNYYYSFCYNDVRRNDPHGFYNKCQKSWYYRE